MGDLLPTRNPTSLRKVTLSNRLRNRVKSPEQVAPTVAVMKHESCVVIARGKQVTNQLVVAYLTIDLVQSNS